MSTLLRLAAKLLEAPLAIPDAPLEPRDAIVVLGAPLTPRGELTQILEERVAAAAALYHAGAGRYVVTSGGVTPPRHRDSGRRAKRDGLIAQRAEADALADGLRAANVPEVIVENRSLTTAENARYTAELIAPLGVRTIWLVTQPFHGKRAALLFRRIGLEPRIWHIADSVQYRDRKRALRWLLREYGSWAAYYLRR